MAGLGRVWFEKLLGDWLEVGKCLPAWEHRPTEVSVEHERLRDRHIIEMYPSRGHWRSRGAVWQIRP